MANYNLFDAASLAMVPVGYKANKLYSVKPDTGAGDFDFSRASYATRVNADGLIEKERGNLLAYSNTFADSSWTKSGVSLTSGQSGYDGTNDAYLVTGSSTSFANIQRSHTAYGSVSTLSIYAKAGNTHFIALQPFGSGSGYVKFNLSTGTVHSIPATPITYAIEDAGNGWWRISVTEQYNSSLCNIYLLDSGGNFNNTPTDSIYIQDAQLEQGLVATEYIETTTAPIYKGVTDNIPRIDYTSGCGSLLLEPSRTNLLPHSEYTLSYGKNEAPILTDNEHTSPEGLVNATNLNINSASEGLYVFPTSVTSGDFWTVSCFVKHIDGSNTIRFGHAGTGFGGDNNNIFNVKTGEVIAESGGTCSIEDYGNGWYRLIATRTASATSTGGLILYGNNETDSNFAVYGFQMEAGSYPTSYIPTYGSSVTRVADDCKNTSASSLIGQTEGTIYAELDWKGQTGAENMAIWMRGGATTYNEMIALFIPNNFKATASVRTSASQEVFLASDVLSDGIIKMAFAYKANNFAFYVNGVLVGTDTNGSVPTCDQIYLGAYPDGGARLGNNKQTLLFKSRLTNNELAALTRPYDTYQEWVDGEGLTWESKTCTTKSILNLQNL
jgi:hypothetical protein